MKVKLLEPFGNGKLWCWLPELPISWVAKSELYWTGDRALLLRGTFLDDLDAEDEVWMSEDGEEGRRDKWELLEVR